MRATTGAVWDAKANNPHYRISELTLPAFGSTGLQQFGCQTNFLPHTSGELLVKTQDRENDTAAIAGRLIELDAGTECEVVNKTGQEIRFTVIEFK